MLLNKATLGLAKFVSEEESRYTLQSIEVTADSATATNGHYLVNVASGENAHQEDSFPNLPGLEHEKLASAGEKLASRILISKTAALSALKAIRAMGKRITVPILGHAAVVTAFDAQETKAYKLAVNSLDSVQTFNAAATGNFPNWQAVVPQGKPAAEIAVNAEYLEKLCAYVREYGNDRCPSIRLTIYDADHAMRLDARTADGQNIMQLLMPLRTDKTCFALRPDQIEAEKDKAAELESAAA